MFPKELDVEQNSLYLFHRFLPAYLAVFTTLANQALSSTSTSCPLSLPSPAHTFSDMLVLPSCRGGEMVKHMPPTPRIRCFVYFPIKSNYYPGQKKNHHRDSRLEERCSTCDIMLDQVRSAQGKRNPRLSTTFGLR